MASIHSAMATEASIDHSLQGSIAYREMMGSLHTRWFLNGKTSAHLKLAKPPRPTSFNKINMRIVGAPTKILTRVCNLELYYIDFN